MKKSMSEVVDAAVAVLLAAGWEPDGKTPPAMVRMPTSKSPPTCSGKGGGELRDFGGRIRYRKGKRRVTVGPRTVNFYTLVSHDNIAGHYETDEHYEGFVQFKSKDLDGIRTEATQ